MTRKFRLLLLSISSLLALWIALCFAIPAAARAWAEKKFAEQCGICDLKFGRVYVLPWSPTHFRIKDVRLRAGVQDFEEVEAEISSLSGIAVLKAALGKEIHLQDLELEGVEVTLTDGDGKRGSTSVAGGLPPFAIEGLALHSGRFTYVRNLKKTHAVFKTSKIEASFSPFGSLEDMNPVARGTATGQIENSGEVGLDLAVHVNPLKPMRVDLSVRARNQNLADLTTFFRENAGVVLKGELLDGKAETKVRGSRLTALVEATYKDFDVKVEPMWDRDETAAFFMNLGTSIAMSERNVGKPRDEKKKNVELEREPKEPIVAFILRGLKEAAIGVARK